MIQEKLKQEKTTIIYSILVILIALSWSSAWQSSNCIVTASDFESHRSIGYMISEQLKEYGWLYPINFGSAHGTGTFTYSYFPYLIPTLLTLIYDYNESFMLTYILFYALSAITMYILLKNITKDIFSSMLVSLFFLISPALNTQYTIYGSYHTIIALPFMLLAISNLVSFERTSSQKHLTLWAIFSILVGLTHIFTYMVYFLITATYLATTRRKKPLTILILSTAILSFYFMPLFLQKSINTGENSIFTPGDAKKALSLLFFKTYTAYDTSMDFNYGPYLLIGTIVSLIFLGLKKTNNKYVYSKSQLKDTIPEYLIFFAVIIMILISIQSYTVYTSQLPLERYGFFAEISFLLIMGVCLSRIKPTLPAYVLMSAFLIIISLDRSRILPILIIPAIILLSSKGSQKTVIAINRDTIILSVLMLLMFYPLTGHVFTSNTSPRYWCTTMPGINTIVTENDVYRDSMESHAALTALTGAAKSGGIGPMPYHSLAGLTSTDESARELLEKEEVTKIVVTVDSNNYQEKYASLFRWYGDPLVIKGTRNSLTQYFLIFSTGYSTTGRDYKMEIVTPTHIRITKNPEKDGQMIHLAYHRWWKTDSKNVKLEPDKDGFMVIRNAQGIENIDILWDYKYFYIGGIVTLASLIALALYLRKHGTQGTTPEGKPDGLPDNEPEDTQTKPSSRRKNRPKKGNKK